MVQRLHPVFGGELVDPSQIVFQDTDDLHIGGKYSGYEPACIASKAEAQRTVANAHTRYFLAHLHRVRDEEAEASPTEEKG